MARFNYQNINPQTISKMSDRDIRAAYSELRSIARKRADRLEAAGFPARRFAPINKIMSDDVAEELTKVAYYLRGSGSSLKMIKGEKEQASLAAHGYDIEDIDAYGRFMEDMRYRYKNRKLPDSGLWADIYIQAERRKMSVETLQQEFEKYLEDEEKSYRLRDALEASPMRTRGKDELTANTLRRVLRRTL